VKRHVATLAVAVLASAAASGSGSAALSACPAANPPNELVLAGGSGQTAQLGKQFPTNLQAQLANSNGCPLTGNLAGVDVEFDAPAGGPSGIFGSGSNDAVVGTDAHGIATAPALTADDTAGSYVVDAHSDVGSVGFDLTNTANGLAAAIGAMNGANQQATVNGAYPQPLQARVTDAAGNPVQGATVGFSIVAGPTGASASFAGGAQVAVTADSNGLATSPPLLANGAPGRFSAVASTDGLSAVATFSLDNHAAAETLAAAGGAAQSASIDTRYARPLTVRLRDVGGQPVEGAAVTFTLGSQGGGAGAVFNGGADQATAVTDADGVATSPRFAANGVPGRFTATATSPGAPPLSFALRNLPAALVLSDGSPTATVATTYRRRLIATVRGANGRRIEGVSVTFSVASSGNGAGATFQDGTEQATEPTDGRGEAASPRLEASTTAGRFTVTAAVAGTSTRVTAGLRNLPGRATTITAGVASGESTSVAQRFPVPLAVTVGDRYGNPVAGAIVEFTAPRRGPSGRFVLSMGRTARVSVETNRNGIAVAPPFTANDLAGGYVVGAAVKGTGAHAAFALVNSP
jgi:protocatechuate 3,4-dioxygenase beta subunit